MVRLVFVIVFFVAFGTAAQEIPGIHARELMRYREAMPLRAYAPVPTFRFAEKGEPIVEKRVFGYLPYWANDTTHLRYPLLTDIAYFSCELGTNGVLGNCHDWPSAAPIAEAHAYGVKVHLVVTGFDKATVLALVGSEGQKGTFFAATYDKVTSAGADGLNIDFEISSGSDSAAIAAFFRDLAAYFHDRSPSLEVSAALWAVDWQDTFAIGEMTGMDLFFIMAYDYHWKGGDPGPVSPLVSHDPWPEGGICVTRSFNDYAAKLGNSGLEHLIVGYPYYGYDWPTTSAAVPGTQTANATSVTFQNIAMSDATYDPASETVYRAYQDGGWHQLWFDTPETFAKKMAFVAEQPAGGTGMWALTYDGAGDEFWREIAVGLTAAGPGSPEDPVVIDQFPFVHDGNTYFYRSDAFDAYTCDHYENSAVINEEGPEIVYRFTVKSGGTLTASLTKGEGSDPAAREDLDVHLLRSPDPDDCINRAHVSLEETLEPGTYYLVVDSYVDAAGVRKGGAYRLEVAWDGEEMPDEGVDEEGTDSDKEAIGDGDAGSDEVSDETLPDHMVQPEGEDEIHDSPLFVDENETPDGFSPDEGVSASSSSNGCGCALVI